MLTLNKRINLTAALLFLIVLVGGGLRLHGLETRTFGHPENYVPGIKEPIWVHSPPHRKDLKSVFRVNLSDAIPIFRLTLSQCLSG